MVSRLLENELDPTGWILTCGMAVNNGLFCCQCNPRYTVIQSYPYNPSSKSALICTSYRDDRSMFELLLHAPDNLSAAANSPADLQLTIAVVLHHCITADAQTSINKL